MAVDGIQGADLPDGGSSAIAVSPSPLPPAPPPAPSASDSTYAPSGSAPSSTDPSKLYNEALPWGPDGGGAGSSPAVTDAHQLAASDPAAGAAIERLEQGDPSPWNSGAPPLSRRVNDFLQGGGDPKLASNVLQQVASPDKILQVGGKEIWAATSTQALFARKDPAGYFNAATELVTMGQATLVNGTRLSVKATDQTWIDARKGAKDSSWAINAAMQAAFMSFATKGAFSLARDVGNDSYGNKNFGGMDIEPFDRLNKAILGESVYSNQFRPMNREWVAEIVASGETPPSMAEQRARYTQQMGHDLQKMMRDNPGGFAMTIDTGTATAHSVIVTSANASGVTFHDPRTGQNTPMSYQDLSYTVTMPIDQGIGTGGTPPPTGGGGARR